MGLDLFILTNKTFYPLAIILLLYKLSFGIIFLWTLVLCMKSYFKVLRPDKSNNKSFPSGHSATAWYIATIYNFNPLLVTWAILVGISRIKARRHYLRDVIVGAILGISFGLIFRQN